MTVFDENKEYWAKKSTIPAALAEIIPDEPDLQILDLGCGGGRIALFLSNKAKAIYGMDYSKELLLEAKKINCKLQPICADFSSKGAWQSLPQLDLIVSNCAIRKDYCPDLKLITSSCYDRLKNGGKIALRVQSDKDLSEILSSDVRSLFYSKKEIEDNLRQFKNVSIKEESYKQRFSSIDYLNQFLKRIQLPEVTTSKLSLFRRYLIISAEK